MEKVHRNFRAGIILPRCITIRSTKYTPTFSTNWSRQWPTTCAKRKSGPGWHRASTMRAEHSILEARCQPGPDFLFAQVVGHGRGQLLRNLGGYFVERLGNRPGKIIL